MIGIDEARVVFEFNSQSRIQKFGAINIFRGTPSFDYSFVGRPREHSDGLNIIYDTGERQATRNTTVTSIRFVACYRDETGNAIAFDSNNDINNLLRSGLID